ncbi:MAG TPA: NifB/NifX family molybdenum-iron cluster-binding protein [Candidatus Woesearchaeota archaeon]|nr:NifB/NifX family molybdenum-iron cluster-binding protein [Candidatus Woesearchaeota archaeon]
MKIAITSVGEDENSMLDQRFGRCQYFQIFDVEDKEVKKHEAIPNQGTIQGHGAGIRASEQLGQIGVNVVITGQLGPNSTSVLKELGITIYSGKGTVKEALRDFLNGELNQITDISKPHSQAPKESLKESPKKVTNERIFIPLMNNNGIDSEISEHFGHAPFFGLYDVSKNRLEIIPNDLDHADPSKSPIEQIQDAVNPTIIFAKSIGGRAISLIQEKGMRLKTGNFKRAGEVIENLDSLKDKTDDCGHKH